MLASLSRLPAAAKTVGVYLRLYLVGLLYFAVNCYTLALAERLRHRRGRIVMVPGYGKHYGLRLELVTVHYLMHLDSWWGWKRHIEPNA